MTTLTTTPACPQCHGTMGLVHQIDLEDMPEIYIFYCACRQLAETVKHERAAQKTSQIIETRTPNRGTQRPVTPGA